MFTINSKTLKINVQKFGGTSLGSIERIEKIADRITYSKSQGKKLVIVVSAMSGETNRLDQLAQQVSLKKGPAYDMLLASGEQVSASLLALALEKRGLKATPLLGYQVGIKTDDLFSRARIREIDTEQLIKCIGNNSIPLVAGFQGVTTQNQITTLGRGGSDTTAVALAAALKQKCCEIFTDVEKVYTADPSLLKPAFQISKLSFEEMMEMSSSGSRVLHCRSVEIAAKYKVKLHVRSSFDETDGTWIVPKEELMETPLVSAITHDLDTVIVKMFPIPKGIGFISKLFDSLAKKAISVDIISQSYNSDGQRLAFSINKEDLLETKSTVYQHIDKNKVSIIENLAKLSVVGVGMANHPGVAARFFNILNQEGLDLHLVTTSEIKISAIIDKKYLSQAMKSIHEEFQLGRTNGL